MREIGLRRRRRRQTRRLIVWSSHVLYTVDNQLKDRMLCGRRVIEPTAIPARRWRCTDHARCCTLRTIPGPTWREKRSPGSRAASCRSGGTGRLQPHVPPLVSPHLVAARQLDGQRPVSRRSLGILRLSSSYWRRRSSDATAVGLYRAWAWHAGAVSASAAVPHAPGGDESVPVRTARYVNIGPGARPL